ncbi:hypothetical protein AAG570_005774 [Ranatra chinensis]|uniref:Uncharacterized protein n=1 Tax=Ranatra chinensis TaxID=642074 RepID=A0ABD0YK63_9HEMI
MATKRQNKKQETTEIDCEAPGEMKSMGGGKSLAAVLEFPGTAVIVRELATPRMALSDGIAQLKHLRQFLSYIQPHEFPIGMQKILVELPETGKRREPNETCWAPVAQRNTFGAAMIISDEAQTAAASKPIVTTKSALQEASPGQFRVLLTSDVGGEQPKRGQNYYREEFDAHPGPVKIVVKLHQAKCSVRLIRGALEETPSLRYGRFLNDPVTSAVGRLLQFARALQVEAGFICCMVVCIGVALIAPGVALGRLCYRATSQVPLPAPGCIGNCKRRTLVFFTEILLVLLL